MFYYPTRYLIIKPQNPLKDMMPKEIMHTVAKQTSKSLFRAFDVG